jgi:molybdenum cofactor guanylyltransferase
MMQFAAIILAGGQSSRMGRDKAFININSIPLLQKTCLTAERCASQVYVITPWLEKYQTLIPTSCQIIQEKVSPSETQPHGPLIGFAQALSWIETEWVLLLACDLPNLTPSAIKEWSRYLEIESVPTEAIALLPKSPKGWEPLCGFYRCRCLPSLNEFIQGGGKSFQKWLEKHCVRELPISERRFLLNCNYPSDLEKI